MGCIEGKVLAHVRKVQVSALPNQGSVKLSTPSTDDAESRPVSGVWRKTLLEESNKTFSRSNSAALFSLNLNESLDSRLSLSFKSQTPSAGSIDSGICELDEEYSHVITEHGPPEQVRQVERDFVPKQHLELCILGRACPRRTSARPREYVDEHLVLQTLREEGLIQRPQCTSTGGLAFEVIAVEEANVTPGETALAGGRKLPPIQLERMESRRKRRKVTKETIQEKLILAEERRKQQEEEKIARVMVRPKTAVAKVEEKFQEETRSRMDKKMEITAANRERKIQELHERMALKRERSAKVRLRKMLNPVEMEETILEEA